MILDVQTRAVEPGITVIEVGGRLTLGTRLTDLEHMIRKNIAEGCRRLVLDLSKLEHLDSAGVGMLVMCAGLMEQSGGAMRVAGASSRVAQTFQITHLDRLVRIEPDAAAACASFG